MNEEELEKYETELRQITPARPPADFMVRLQSAKPGLEPSRSSPAPVQFAWLRWPTLLRWLAPAMALVAVGLLLTREKFNAPRASDKKPVASATALNPADVVLDQELVSSFDVVASLPGGEPVRFRCQKWNQQLVLTDRKRGIEFQESVPRVEVVPVRFETF